MTCRLYTLIASMTVYICVLYLFDYRSAYTNESVIECCYLTEWEHCWNSEYIIQKESWLREKWINHSHNHLTHWGRVTHICVGNQTIIGSDNGMSPFRRHSLSEPMLGYFMCSLGTNISEILSGINTFDSTKCIWNCCLRDGGRFVPAAMCWTIDVPSGSLLSFCHHNIFIAVSLHTRATWHHRQLT